MGWVLSDVRYAWRRLLQQPGFTLAAVLTLALGTGINIALFTILNAILLRPTPGVREPDRLVAIYTSDYSGPTYGGSSFPDYEAIAQTDVFTGATAFTPQVAGIGDPDTPVRVGVEIVTPNFFEVLGVPVRGRPLHAEHARSNEPVAVISDALWRTQFGADPGTIGSTLRVNGNSATIVGIAPPGFRGGFRGFAADVWLPIAAGEQFGLAYDLDERGNRGLSVMARLRDGVTPATAAARMRVLAAQLHAAYGDYWTDVNDTGRRLTVLEERAARVPPMMRAPVLGFAALLSGMVGLVLLLCCANLAGLMLTRVSARSREIAVRLSIGATQGRIRRLLLTESLLLSLTGAVVGLIAAVWAVDALLALLPSRLPIPIAINATLDARVIAFVIAVAIVAALLFGSAPAMRASRADLSLVMRSRLPDLIQGRRLSLSGVLVAAQVAASVVLLVTALLFMRSLRAASGVDLGYATRDVVLLDLEPKPGVQPDPESYARTSLELTQRIAQLPDVRGVTWASNAPLGGGSSRRGTTIEGYSPASGEDMEFHLATVGPDYFATLQLPLAAGRDISIEDRGGAPGVMVVNETFARRFFPGQIPLGKRISLSGPDGDFLTVVGVARDAKFVNVTGDAVPHMFVPALQEPRGTLLHVRTTVPPADFQKQVRAIAAEIAPSWEVLNPRSMEAQVGMAVLPQRIAGRVLAGFGVLALILAAVGLYGVVAFAVAQRTREMGIRIALGASQSAVIGLTMRQGMRIVGIGLIAGVILAAGVTQLIGFLLLGMNPFDPASYAGAATLLLAVTALAMYVPARRAVRVDPLAALRTD